MELYVVLDLNIASSVFFPHTVFVCPVWLSEKNKDYFPIQH